MTSASFTTASPMFSPSVLPVTVMQSRFSVPGFAGEGFEDRADAAGAVDIFHVILARRARPCRCTARARETSLRCSRSNGCPASMAIASVCSTVLVLPPMATSRAKAFSNALGVRMSLGRMFLLHEIDDPPARFGEQFIAPGSVARMLPLPGSARPSASHRQFMLLAVNMPEQEPQVGQACCFDVGAAGFRSSCRRRLCRRLQRRVARSIASPVDGLAGLHRPAADEDRGDVHARRAHHHAGDDLVAVGDADDAVEAVGAEHRLDAVGDQLARGERILHADVAHGDAVIDADGVEFERNAARRANGFAHFLADHIQMGMARNDLHEASCRRR